MPNPFEAEGFPGQAVGKGAAQVINSEFTPDDTPPVDVSGLPDSLPVDPVTGLPTIPVVDIQAITGFSPEDMPGNVPEDILDILF
mgnify:CR=1 FL=1